MGNASSDTNDALIFVASFQECFSIYSDVDHHSPLFAFSNLSLSIMVVIARYPVATLLMVASNLGNLEWAYVCWEMHGCRDKQWDHVEVVTISAPNSSFHGPIKVHVHAPISPLVIAHNICRIGQSCSHAFVALTSLVLLYSCNAADTIGNSTTALDVLAVMIAIAAIGGIGNSFLLFNFRLFASDMYRAATFSGITATLRSLHFGQGI